MARPLRLLRWLLLGALAWQMSTFVAPRTARGTQDVSNPVALHAERPKPMNQEGRQTLAELLAPADQLFEETEDGMILREKYAGGRQPSSVFWAVVSLGFLVVGLSAFFGEPIVDWTPITAQYLGFLRPSEGINFLPQGAFMCFYGFFGFFVFGPIQWYINIFNIGQGVCEFNKNDGMMYIVRNNEMIREVPLEDFQAVKFEWTNLAVLGARDVYLICQDGKEIHFMDDPEVYSKFVLEKRAAKLSEFLNVELIVDDA
ncbi:Photosystem I assembly protein Ycf4 [Durusdinium trenchii]|uniref:Photosystem I assembly protein Ycf4 n=1 Tax=Durusdinium trenchii TaxID=1381693 RepID=A0ABP0R2U5_9DINO